MLIQNGIHIVVPDRHHIYHDAGASIRDNHTTFINRHSMHEDDLSWFSS